MSEPEEYLTVEQLAARLGWSPKTIQNKMGRGGVFKKGVHFAEAPGLPVLFKWSAIVELYKWDKQSPEKQSREGAPAPEKDVSSSIPMARGYSMK